jgi:hypothetical protein
MVDLSVLGITEEELQTRLVEKYVSDLRISHTTDEDGDEIETSSQFDRAVRKAITDAIDSEVHRIADAYVLPRVATMIESHVIQKTNSWGDKVGQPMTFTEYLVQRTEEYITEKVDYDGKSRSECQFSSWTPKQTRVAHMIDKHLHYSIDTAVKKALADLNSAVAKGLAATVQVKIEEALSKIKIETKVS